MFREDGKQLGAVTDAWRSRPGWLQWTMERTVRPRRSLCERRTFNIESVLASIGVNNEHFLHHRRSRGRDLCCRFLWPARLNRECNIRLTAADCDSGPAGTTTPEPGCPFVSSAHGCVLNIAGDMTTIEVPPNANLPPRAFYDSRDGVVLICTTLAAKAGRTLELVSLFNRVRPLLASILARLRRALGLGLRVADGFGEHLAQLSLCLRRLARVGFLPLGHDQHMGMVEG